MVEGRNRPGEENWVDDDCGVWTYTTMDPPAQDLGRRSPFRANFADRPQSHVRVPLKLKTVRRMPPRREPRLGPGLGLARDPPNPFASIESCTLTASDRPPTTRRHT